MWIPRHGLAGHAVALSLPRIVVAGLAGDAGKTLVASGIIRALRRRGLAVAPFKKGPDYIDPSWLGFAAGRRARSLDAFLMSRPAILASLASAHGADIAVIEGNRGLFDGVDARGTYSTAELAKDLAAPVLLVLDVSKATRTVAALVAGCRALDAELALAGVILNRVGSSRQEHVIREALALATGVPVLGAIPRLSCDPLPSRRLGLVMPGEREEGEHVLDLLGKVIEAGVDLGAALEVARAAAPLPSAAAPAQQGAAEPSPVRIGVLQDAAFCFYYPENLDALAVEGASLVPISPLRDSELPAIDALYAGGGYPEAHAQGLANNVHFRAALAAAIAQGLPVWAECGGLMYLSRAIVDHGQCQPMVGALPLTVEQTERAQGHGYVEATVDTPNPFLALGTPLRGHEFHYSRPAADTAPVPTALALRSGVGLGGGRDGIVVGRVFASYMHVLAPAVPAWAPGVVRVAREARAERAVTPPQPGENRDLHRGAEAANRSRRGWLHSGARALE